MADRISARGFTLIELIIVIIVLGIAMGILVPFIVSLKGSANPVLMQQAATLAQERLEQIIADRRATNTAPPRGFIYATSSGNYPGVENLAPTFPNFTRTVSIVCVTTLDFNAAPNAGNAPNPSCTLSDGRTDYARVTVTVTHPLVGDVNAETLLGNY